MNPIEAKAWRVFRSAFKDGESVVVEDQWGVFHWGTLRAGDEGITLTRPGGTSREIAWEDVEFVCHDGFPVQPLLKMTPEEAAKRARWSSGRVVEELLALGRRKGRYLNGSPPGKADIAVHRRFGGGCPFVAGPAQLVEVHNRGNLGPRFWERWDVETLIFQAADGAQMHSYDSEHLFLDL